MIVELHIKDFAIIDRLDVDFANGLIAFTGETGAGKSIIVDAVETLLGGRTEATLVRSGCNLASVEGVFSIPAAYRNEILTLLEREDLSDDPERLTLSREIRANGRSSARVNGHSVNAGLLRELGEYLIDVHGQSEHLSLLHVNQHLNLLDNYLVTMEGAAAQEQIDGYRQTYQRVQGVKQELATLRQAERDAVRRADILNYQIKEIDSARLQTGEEQELLNERNRLANAAGLASLAQEALLIMDEGTPESPAITDLTGQVLHAMQGLERLDPTQAALVEQAESLSESLSDLAIKLRDYVEGIEFNPRRLDQVEERINVLQNLKRKYGDSIHAVLAFAEKARGELAMITHSAERIAELEAEHVLLLQQLADQGLQLSEKRRAAAEQLSKAMEKELSDLKMPGAHFRVDFQRQPDPEGVVLPDGEALAYTANGLEKVEFLIAPNPGEGFKPLAKIASGGETSRLMLALKNTLARADHIPTLIFDEIDQGIGGRVGTIVGEKLWELARQHQVLCITHLPQLAAFGEQHFHVQKQIEGGRTITQVGQLEGEKRLMELALMLGEVSEGTLQSARDLLEYAAKRVNR
jgi:DNA repair protein RecN (Recombination protein N)